MVDAWLFESLNTKHVFPRGFLKLLENHERAVLVSEMNFLETVSIFNFETPLAFESLLKWSRMLLTFDNEMFAV